MKVSIRVRVGVAIENILRDIHDDQITRYFCSNVANKPNILMYKPTHGGNSQTS